MCGVQIALANIIPTNSLYGSQEPHLAHLEELSIAIFVRGMDTMRRMNAFIMPKSPSLTQTNNKLGKLTWHRVHNNRLTPHKCQDQCINNPTHLNPSFQLPTMPKDPLGKHLKIILPLNRRCL